VDVGSCAIYNAYFQKNDVEQFVENCDKGIKEPSTPINAFKDSWSALDLLATSMSDQLDKGNYTHILVITMGWNTSQEEAIRNFNSISSNLKMSIGKQNFNPLVIGVTWPSMWANSWIPPIVDKLFSFPVKSNDADNLGLSWLGVLLNRTIPAVKKNVPVVVVGHSFGARASSVAACVGPVIFNKEQDIVHAPIDYLINLQGAFRTVRLFGKDSDKFYFPSMCKNVVHFVMVASDNDFSMPILRWGAPYAGDNRSYDEYCGTGSTKIHCGKATKLGEVTYREENVKFDSNLYYINVNELITENAYLTGGGAHSDIYRREHGVMMRDILSLK